MKTNNSHRFKQNPLEEQLCKNFIKEMDKYEQLDRIIFGCRDDAQAFPKDTLTDRERDICATLMQWLGSPVGQSFLRDNGFERKNN
jgi:hypothetical protein